MIAGIDIRAITEDEFPQYARAVSRGFGFHLTDDLLEKRRSITDLSRTLAAFDGKTVVGTNNSRRWRINVPGGSAPVAGIVSVTVQPTHRRRGILRRMMGSQLRDLQERGEPIAALYSSESAIYGRFGFGLGVMSQTLTFERQRSFLAWLHAQLGAVRFVEPDEMRATFPKVERRALRNRPGAIPHPDYDWDKRQDASAVQGGGQTLFNAVYEVDGRVDGAVQYYHETSGKGEIRIAGLWAATDDAYAALWKFVLGIDMIETITAPRRPLDDPIFWMLDDPGRLGMEVYANSFDSMWIRLVDVAEALGLRTYRVAGKIAFEVRDLFCPWNEGVYLLDGGPDGAACRTTNIAPDLVLSAADLAACYLGAVSFSALARAGRVEERTSGALASADLMFSSELAPWCPFSY